MRRVAQIESAAAKLETKIVTLAQVSPPPHSLAQSSSTLPSGCH